MKDLYIEKISNLLEKCENENLLDLILKLLEKGVN